VLLLAAGIDFVHAHGLEIANGVEQEQENVQ